MTRWQGRIPLLVGVTGHQNLHPDEQGRVERQVADFLGGLRSRLAATPIVVLSQLAEGADQLVASLALATGCESVCVLPLELSTYRSRFKSDTARANFDRLFAASSVLELPGLDAFANERHRGYAAAGYYVAHHSTILLALWDGVASVRPGSTGDVVRERLAWWVGPGDPAVFHLLVRRRDSSPTSHTLATLVDGAAGSVGLTLSRDLSAPAAIEVSGWMDAERFNKAVCAAIEHGGLAGAPEPFVGVPDQRIADVAASFRAASTIAVDAQRMLRRRRLLLQTVAFLAAIAFAGFLKFTDDQWLLWLYLALLGGAATLRLFMRREELHRRYLDYRCLAEGLRVLLFWRIAGVSSGARSESPTWLLGGQDPSLSWIGWAMTALDGWMGRMPLTAAFDGCQFAARHWFGFVGSHDAHAQIPYYRGAARHLQRLAARLDLVVNTTLLAGLITAVILATVPMRWLGPAAPALLVIMGFLPLVSGSASAAVDVPAEQEVARRYGCMANLFVSAAQRFATASSDEERRQILLDVGTAALAEQRVWHAVFRQKAPDSRLRR